MAFGTDSIITVMHGIHAWE